jgi:hypothetical protein
MVSESGGRKRNRLGERRSGLRAALSFLGLGRGEHRARLRARLPPPHQREGRAIRQPPFGFTFGRRRGRALELFSKLTGNRSAGAKARPPAAARRRTIGEGPREEQEAVTLRSWAPGWGRVPLETTHSDV